MVSKRAPPFSRNGCCAFLCFSGEPPKLAGEPCLHGYSSNHYCHSFIRGVPVPGALDCGNSALKSGACNRWSPPRGEGHRPSGTLERNHFCSSLELFTTGAGTANVLQWAVLRVVCLAWVDKTGSQSSLLLKTACVSQLLLTHILSWNPAFKFNY